MVSVSLSQVLPLGNALLELFIPGNRNIMIPMSSVDVVVLEGKFSDLFTYVSYIELTLVMCKW